MRMIIDVLKIRQALTPVAVLSGFLLIFSNSVSAGDSTPVKNQPPIVSPISTNVSDVDPGTAGLQVYNKGPVTYSATATDPEGNTLRWKWTYRINYNGKEIVFSSGTGSLAPATFDYTGKNPENYRWAIYVGDGSHTVKKSLSTQVLAAPVNRPPVWSPFSDLSANTGPLIPYVLPEATDADNDPLTYSTQGLPLGAGFDASTRTLTWAPDSSQAGDYQITFSVSDGQVAISQILSVKIIYVAPNQPPVATPQSLQGNEDQPMTITLSGTDPDSRDSITGYRLVTVPQYGQATLNEDTVSYAPNTDFAGDDSLVFEVMDSYGAWSQPATVSLEILPGLPFDDSGLAPVGLEAIVALPKNLAVFNVKDYGAAGDGVTDDTLAIRAAINAAVAATGGIIYFPMGTYAVAMQSGDSGTWGSSSDWPAIFVITSSNLTFIGDGAEKSKLVGYMSGLQDPVTRWDIVGDGMGYSKIKRFTMFRIDSSATGKQVSDIQWRSLTLDGQAGYTGNSVVGGNVATGDGWDMSHKAIAMGGANPIDNVLVFNSDIVRWRGEEIYAGGGENLGRISIISTTVRSSNASAISATGTVLVSHSILGGPNPGDDVYNGLENFAFPGQSNKIQDSTIQCASVDQTRHGNGLVLSGYPGTSAIIQRNTFTRCWYGVLFSEAAHNVQILNNTFTNNTQSMITSILGLNSGWADKGWNGWDYFTISGNTVNESGCLFLIQNYEWGKFPYLTVTNNTITKGALLGGAMAGLLENYPEFIVDGNILGAGAKDVNYDFAFRSTAMGLWTNTTRLADPALSAGVKIDDFSGGTTTYFSPVTDLTFLNESGWTGVAHYGAIDPMRRSHHPEDPVKVAMYPIGFTTKIIAGRSNWILKADPTWNTFPADQPVGPNGLRIRFNAEGKFEIVT